MGAHSASYRRWFRRAHSARGRSALTPAPLATKATLTPAAQAGRERLANLDAELDAKFDAGEPIESVIKQRADAIDRLVAHAWEAHVGEVDGIALIAVGGYGRAELHPQSDIDLLILSSNRAKSEFESRLSEFVRALWDMGLQVGHSVRSLRECVRVARDDVTVMTNLLDLRCLSGDAALMSRLQRLLGARRMWSPRRFVAAKLAELNARHSRFNDTAYNLEPNLKEGLGGLRDIQTVEWMARRAFGAKTLDELIDKNLLREPELQALNRGRSYLWKLRYALHRLADRPEERLLFQHQRALAEQFGFEDDDSENAGVEQFMQTFFRNAVMVERLCGRLIYGFKDELERTTRLTRAVKLTDEFKVRKRRLEVADEGLFESDPLAMLRVFLVLNQSSQVDGMAASTVRLIRRWRDLIDADFRARPEAKALFVEILRQRAGVYRSLKLMNQYGVLVRYMPMFDHVVGLMQFDLFHVYTVDQHTLFVLRNLERFRRPEFENKFPLAATIMPRIQKPELLFLGGFFHDIAKGRGGDHSTLGEAAARTFCQEHGIGEVDAELVAWMVRHHLLFSMTAQHRDLSDPEIVHEFCTLIGERERLDYLYLLTVADICATSPKLWTGWKDRLLATLYTAASAAFDRGLKNPLLRSEKADTQRRESRAVFESRGVAIESIDRLWDRLPLEYFLRYDLNQLIWQIGSLLETQPDELRILVRERPGRSTTEVFVHAPDVAGSFASVTAVLDQLNLRVTEAIVVTSNDRMSLDSMQVVGSDGDPLTRDVHRVRRIYDALKSALTQAPDDRPQREMREMSRRLQHFAAPCQLSFNEYDERSTRVLIRASDRPGLLAGVAKVFAEQGASVHDARVATFGDQAEDVFLISDGQGSALTQDAIEQLEQALREQLDAGIEELG